MFRSIMTIAILGVGVSSGLAFTSGTASAAPVKGHAAHNHAAVNHNGGVNHHSRIGHRVRGSRIAPVRHIQHRFEVQSFRPGFGWQNRGVFSNRGAAARQAQFLRNRGFTTRLVRL